MAPWTKENMLKKGARRKPGKAAAIANAILRRSGNEGMAIATALKKVNKPKAKRRKLFPR